MVQSFQKAKEAACRKDKVLLVQFFKDAPVPIDVDALIEKSSLKVKKGIFALVQEENQSQKIKIHKPSILGKRSYNYFCRAKLIKLASLRADNEKNYSNTI